MAVKIPAPDLDRVVQNCLLYADSKALRLNDVLFEGNGESISVYSCDDYVTLKDTAPLSEGLFLNSFSLSVSDVDALGDWIKKDKKVVHKYEISLRRKMTGIIFECDETSTDEDSDNIFLRYTNDQNEAWEIVKELLSLENARLNSGGFSVRPERLAKLARVKADKDAPISMRFVDVRGLMIIQFKKGESAYGAIMPVKEEYVREEFLW